MDKMVDLYSEVLNRIPLPYGWSGINVPGVLETASGLWVTKAGARIFPLGFQYSPAVNPHWEWGALLRGGLDLQVDGGIVKASEGYAYLMPPDIHLTARPSIEPFLVWVEISGPAASSAFSQFGGKPKELIITRFTPEQVKSALRIARLLHEHPYGYELMVQASLWSFLADSINPGSASAKKFTPEIGRVLDYLQDTAIPSRCTMTHLAGLSGLPVETFRKRFSQETGSPPIQYALKLQIKKAKELLADGTLSVKQVAFESGFDDQYYFSRLFKQYEGLNPSEYRKRFYPEL